MLEYSHEREVCLGVVEKLSGTGFSFHKRLLCLDEGVLSYFKKVPLEAENGNFDIKGLKAQGIEPKSSIEARHIKSVKALDKASAQKKKRNFIFTIEFKKSAVFKGNKKDSVNPKEGADAYWMFAVKEEDTLEKWVSIIDSVKKKEIVKSTEKVPIFQKTTTMRKPLPPLPINQPQLEKSITINRQEVYGNTEKIKENIVEIPAITTIQMTKLKEEQDMDGRESPNKSSFATGDRPKKLKRVQIRETTNVYEESGDDTKADERLREKEEELMKKKMREEETKKREEEEREKRQKEIEENNKKEREREERKKKEQQEKLQQAWEFKFNMIIEENLRAFDKIEDRIKTGFKIIQFIGSFRTQAVNICKNIIDEMCQPYSERNYLKYEAQLNKRDKKSRDLVQRIFFLSNIIVQITWADREQVEMPDEREVYIYTDKMIKSYGHEFRAMDILNDTLYLLNKSKRDVVFRVPLAVSVDYKGFKCLVISSPPLDGEVTLHLGPLLSSGTYRTNKSLNKDIKFIADKLNLKDHSFVLNDGSSIEVALSVFTELHKVEFNDYEDDKNRNKSAPPSEGNPTFSDRRDHDCYYFMSTADIFPVDVDLDSNKNSTFLKRLRPEFLLEYERPLSADALVNTADNPQNESDDIEVAEAGIYLRTVVIPSFVKKLDALEIILVDSASVTQAFHCHGINMRYLGLVCQKTNLPHVKEVCITEMVARAVKKVLRKQIADIVRGTLEEPVPVRDTESESVQSKEKSSSIGGRSLQKKEDERKGKTKPDPLGIDRDIEEGVIDFLNLIFGKGRESALFWSEIIANQVLYDFNYDMKNFQKTEISLGGLLHAVIYHCNIKIMFDNKIEERLDKVPNPFTRESFLGMQVRSKVFSNHSLDVKSLSERYKIARASKEYDAAIKSCLLALSIEKQIASQKEDYQDPTLIGDMGEIYFESGDYKKALEKAEEGLKYARPYHVEAVKCFCILMRYYMVHDKKDRNDRDMAIKNFEQAISYLNFHVGQYHPLHATVYSILGYHCVQRDHFQDALLLYKSSLVCCIRILGPNHPYTGEVYLDLGNLTLKMHQQEDALNYFEKAFYVFEASKGEDSIECASASYVMATLLMAFGKVNEARENVMHAMRIYEKNEKDYAEKIAECCLLLCNIGEVKSQDKLTLDHANKIWNIINKYPTENSMHYKSKILTLTLTAIINTLTTDKKNFLYSISDAIMDVLGQENMLDKVNGGGEEISLQKEYLQDIFIKSQGSKNIQNFLRDMLKTLFQKLQERDFKPFFSDYRRNLEDLDDPQLKECLKDFEKLIFIHGFQYFQSTLKKF